MLEECTKTRVKNILKRMKKGQDRLDNLTRNGKFSIVKLNNWFLTYHPSIARKITVKDIENIDNEVGLEVVKGGQ